MIQGTICPRCGKEFFPTDEWVYADGRKKWCSWTCYNHREEKKIVRRNAKRVMQYSLDGKHIRTFDSAREAAECMGCLPDTIRDACRGQRGGKAVRYVWKYQK